MSCQSGIGKQTNFLKQYNECINIYHECFALIADVKVLILSCIGYFYSIKLINNNKRLLDTVMVHDKLLILLLIIKCFFY